MNKGLLPTILFVLAFVGIAVSIWVPGVQPFAWFLLAASYFSWLAERTEKTGRK